MRDASSRYAGLPERMVTLPGGRVAPVLAQRVIPAPGEPPGGLCATRQDERPDALAARVLGDPLQWWRLCDANRLSDAQDLVGPSRRVLRLPPLAGEGTP
jgi:hypothetical protein